MKKKHRVSLCGLYGIMIFLVTGFIVIITTHAAGGPPGYCDDDPQRIETGVFKTRVVLSPSLEPQRSELEKDVVNAQRRVREFARAHGWENLVKDSFFDKVEIYDLKDAYNRRIIELCKEAPSTEIPASFCAALERRVLVVVSPRLFREANPKFVEDAFYQKVMAHEIVHRLHVRIVADENAMGPFWVFEGFAMFGADQLKDTIPELSRGEILEIMRGRERIDYRKYNAVFRYFVKRVPLQRLIRKAGDDKYVEWLEKLVEDQGAAEKSL
ncbi:MAG: hypothetical protein RDV48_20760 [Candidatus Eremiobacteraeota bacterium]|nr:hypothetical protein [Candidatus Eremiobacteraeota bacterium]